MIYDPRRKTNEKWVQNLLISKNLFNDEQVTFNRDEILHALEEIISKINDLCEIIKRWKKQPTYHSNKTKQYR